MPDDRLLRIGASAMGMVRRTDVGPDVWEMPDGKLYKHWDDSVPVFEKVMSPMPRVRPALAIARVSWVASSNSLQAKSAPGRVDRLP